MARSGARALASRGSAFAGESGRIDGRGGSGRYSSTGGASEIPSSDDWAETARRNIGGEIELGDWLTGGGKIGWSSECRGLLP